MTAPSLPVLNQAIQTRSSLVDDMAGTTPGHKKLIGIVCRGVLGMATAGTLGDENNPTNRIILDFRYRALAHFVAESKADKI